MPEELNNLPEIGSNPDEVFVRNLAGMMASDFDANYRQREPLHKGVVFGADLAKHEKVILSQEKEMVRALKDIASGGGFIDLQTISFLRPYLGGLKKRIPKYEDDFDKLCQIERKLKS